MAYPSQSVLNNFAQLEEAYSNKQSPFKTHKFDDLTNSAENWDISIGKGKN
jgi:esterase/lipase superfamily enzyme